MYIESFRASVRSNVIEDESAEVKSTYFPGPKGGFKLRDGKIKLLWFREARCEVHEAEDRPGGYPLALSSVLD
jgi:hypothetical protein